MARQASGAGMASHDSRGLTAAAVLRWGHARCEALRRLHSPAPRFVAELEREYLRRQYAHQRDQGLAYDPYALQPCTCPPVLPALEDTLTLAHGYGWVPGTGWVHE